MNKNVYIKDLPLVDCKCKNCGSNYQNRQPEKYPTCGDCWIKELYKESIEHQKEVDSAKSYAPANMFDWAKEELTEDNLDEVIEL